MTHELPQIDFSRYNDGADARAQIAQDMDAACRTLGAFYLTQHGLPKPTTQACFAAARDFFALTPQQKHSIHIANSPCNRGWYEDGREVLDPRAHPEGDCKEGIKIGCDMDATHPRVRRGLPLHGPNQWPDEAALGLAQGLTSWRATMQTYYDACSDLAAQVMRCLALGLGLAERHFDQWLTQPMATLSPLRYPPQPQGRLSAAAHTDFGCLTLLMQEAQPGLEVETPHGWLAVAPLADAFVVNLGDMMARWTNDIYRSPRHRVRNLGARARHSLAFFFDPDPDTPLAVLPGLLQKGERAHYPPTTGLAHLLHKIDESLRV